MFQIVLFNRPKSLNLSHKIDSAGSFFSHPIFFFFSKLFPQKVPMHVGRISILSLQSSHIFFKMFKMRKYWVPIEANRILWQKLAKKGEMSPITLSLPLKARKRPLPDGFLSTMKVEVSNKYSKVYCYCCHLCSQKKPTIFLVKIKENEVLNQKS